MLAVTKPVAAALAKGCDAWHLRLDKFSFERDGAAEAKTESLKQVRDGYKRVASRHVNSATDRCRAWLELLQRQHGARFGVVELIADSRLLLHLGRASVLENVGLCAERTTGLPIIPGTALKGVVSTWACWANHFNPADGSFREFSQASTRRRNFTAAEARLGERILGDDNTAGSEHAGEVIFVGGFPLSTPSLGLDIANPHHDPQGRELTRLTPNAFLCVEPGSFWRFAFFARPGAPDVAALVTQTKTWIVEVLTQIGIGAKTAAGYGRFRRPTDTDAAEQRHQHDQAVAAQALAARQAEAEAARAKRNLEAQQKLQSDYPNDISFKNRVLDKLNPGQLDQLRLELALLQKPENAVCREQLKQVLASRDYKDIRKRLRGKDWFPPDWLPPQ